MWRVANSLITLLSQLNQKYPDRSRISDGTIGDAAHAATASDHNVNNAGVVTALDVTHDPSHGLDIAALAETLRVNKDPRIKYVIANRRIFIPPNWEWVAYNGSSDPHVNHLHISVSANPNLYDNNNQWNLGEPMPYTDEQMQAVKDDRDKYAEQAGLDAYLLNGRPSNQITPAERRLRMGLTWEQFRTDIDKNLPATKTPAELLADVEGLKAENAHLIETSDKNIDIAIKAAQKTVPSATKAPYFVNLVKALFARQ